MRYILLKSSLSRVQKVYLGASLRVYMHCISKSEQANVAQAIQPTDQTTTKLFLSLKHSFHARGRKEAGGAAVQLAFSFLSFLYAGAREIFPVDLNSQRPGV